MVAIPLASQSDPERREVVNPERLVNLYPIASSNPNARAKYYLNRTPGFGVATRLSSDLCRGLYNADTEGLALYGSTLYRINSSLGPTSIGTISGTGDVRWSQNNAADRETAIVTGTTAYQYVAGGALTVISDNDLPANPIDTICFNGYTLMFFENGKVYYSAINDANNYDAASFFTVPGIGPLRCAMLVGDRFVVWRAESMYFYRHVPDDAEDPFQLLSGADSAFGCINTFANAKVSDYYCFVDQEGMPRIIGQGGKPTPIGNDGVVSDVKELLDKSEVRCWGYTSGDRAFLVVRSSEFSWEYDFKEQRWHERISYQRVTWQAKHHMRFANKDLVASDQAGGLFYLDETSYYEDDKPIVWEFTTPPTTNFPNGGTIRGLSFDIEVGTALGATAAAADQEPKITVFISRDGGKTFGTGRQLSLGTRGQWRKRLSLNRCGSFGREGFVIRASGSGATPNAIMNLDAQIEAAAA